IGPSLAAVEPGTVVAGVRTPIALHGSGFRVAVTADLGEKTASAEPIAAIAGTTPLETPVLRDDGLVEAVLPGSLEPGLYRVGLSVRWTVGSVSGVARASAPLRAMGRPQLSVLLQAPAEIEAGDEQSFSATISAPAPMALTGLAAAFTAGGALDLATDPSLSGAGLPAGGTLQLKGSIRGA